MLFLTFIKRYALKPVDSDGALYGFLGGVTIISLIYFFSHLLERNKKAKAEANEMRKYLRK